MKARTRNDTKIWFEFRIEDGPLMIHNNEFVLQNRPGTPRLITDDMVRGCEEYNLYDGDIVLAPNGKRYMICYERGFYAMDEDCNYTLLQDIVPCTTIGNAFDDEFPVPHKNTRKIQFHYKEITFSFKDFQGVHPYGHIVRSLCLPVNSCELYSDCGAKYNGKNLYWDDNVVFQYGRILYKNPNGELIPVNKKGIK